MPSAARQELEMKAAAVIEQQRRKSKRMTVYGIVSKTGKLVRCWQDQDGEFVEVDMVPDVNIPEVAERALIIPKPIKILDGGRGSSKSETVSTIMSARVKDYGHKVGAFREFQTTIEDSVHSLISKKIRELNFYGFEIQEKRILHENGGSVKYRGIARNPTGIKSMDDFDDFWIEEAEVISEKSLEIIEPTARKKGSEIWYTLNRGKVTDPISVEHLKPYEKELKKHRYYEDDTIMIIQMHYTDNFWFPEVLEKKRLRNKKMWPVSKYNNIWDGKDRVAAEGALWSDKMIKDARDKPYGEIVRTVIAVDPIVSNNKNSDTCGIVVCSLDENDEGVVQADLSKKESTKKWAQRAVNAYYAYNANAIVAEVNQGGDLVEDVIKNIDPNVKVVKVHASKGKFARAEPVAALYETNEYSQCSVTHLEAMPDLEEELTQWEPENSTGSPDRLDALVWGLTYLMVKSQTRTNIGTM